MRRNKRTMLKKKNRRMSKKYRGGEYLNENSFIISDADKYENILLIIDPQNDFSEAKGSIRPAGSLQVTGSNMDYQRIISFIQQNINTLSEIHVSLDTHTKEHIGHPSFWTRVGKNGVPLTNEYGQQIGCDDTDGLRVLSKGLKNSYTSKEGIKIDEKTIYEGTSVIGDETRYYAPMNHGTHYDELCKYVEKYIEFYYSSESKHHQLPWIWKEHCIEGTDGHKIAKELKDVLDGNFINDDIVKEDFLDKVNYHIKGQNNLAEMYSIFSAEMPVSKEDAVTLEEYMNTSKYKTSQNGTNKYEKSEGVRFYEELKCGTSSDNKGCDYLNLDTTINTGLMDRLLGIDSEGRQTSDKPRRVFICGEAKSHCVKSSLIDLMEYATKKEIGDPNRIVLLADMTTSIPGTPSDYIEDITTTGKDIYDKKYDDEKLHREGDDSEPVRNKYTVLKHKNNK